MVTHQYVNPVVTAVLGALVLDERPEPWALAAAALILAAVVVTAQTRGPPGGGRG